MDFRLKREYEPARRADGYRILIDRLWPRGLSRSSYLKGRKVHPRATRKLRVRFPVKDIAWTQ